MASAAETLFASINSIADIEDLIASGEAEGQYLECKSPGAPQLRGGLREQLGEAVSGFANSGGGVILWGVSTVHHAHNDLDVLTSVEPIATARHFAQQVDRAIRLQSHPVVDAAPSRVLAVSGSSRGVVATLIPATPGDPIQAVHNKNFYFRSGDSFVELPYEVLQRMFAGSAGPVLRPVLNANNVKRAADGTWTVPLTVQNHSTAVADPGARVLVQVLNPTACESITAEGFDDISGANSGQTLYVATLSTPTFRGFRTFAGRFKIRMKKVKGYKRVLNIRVRILAHRMRGHQWDLRIQLAPSKGFSVTPQGDQDLY